MCPKDGQPSITLQDRIPCDIYIERVLPQSLLKIFSKFLLFCCCNSIYALSN